MTKSRAFAMPAESPPQSNAFVDTTTELLLSPDWMIRLRGSLLHNEPFTTYLYPWFVRADSTSADHTPVAGLSFVSGFAVVLQPLKLPATLTLEAPGAHTRNVVPDPSPPA